MDSDEARLESEAERRRYKAWLGNGKRWITSGVNDEPDATPESSKGRVDEKPLDSEDVRNFRQRKNVPPSVTDDWDADLIPIKRKPRKTEEVKEEESSQPNEEAPVKWTTRGWEQPENEPDNTPDSTALVDKEAESKAVAVPEHAATVLGHEVKEGSRASSLKMESCFGVCGELEKALNTQEYLQCIFSFFQSKWMSGRENVCTLTCQLRDWTRQRSENANANSLLATSGMPFFSRGQGQSSTSGTSYGHDQISDLSSSQVQRHPPENLPRSGCPLF